MAKPINPKAIVRKWADKMRPFAAKHARPENFSSQGPAKENGFGEGYSDSEHRVTFDNLGEFRIYADYFGGEREGIGKPCLSRFFYGRNIGLYDEATDSRMNSNLAAGLVVPVIDWAAQFGLKAWVPQSGIVEVTYPAIVAGGDLPPERFGDYLALVQQIENHIDWGINREDQTMNRPYSYALVDAPRAGREDLFVYQPIEGIENLAKAQHVLVSRQPLHSNLLNTAFSKSDQFIVETAKKVRGKIMTTDDFVRARLLSKPN